MAIHSVSCSKTRTRMKCKGKLICETGAQWLGVLAHFSVIHTWPDIKSVSTWLNSFPEVVLAQGEAAVEARLCCPTAHVTELTFLIAALSQLCAAARVCPTRTADLGGGKPSQHSQEWEQPQTRAASHPHLHTPAFAAGVPARYSHNNGELPQCNNTSPGQLSTDHCAVRPWARKSPEKKWDCSSWLVLQQQELCTDSGSSVCSPE